MIWRIKCAVIFPDILYGLRVLWLQGFVAGGGVALASFSKAVGADLASGPGLWRARRGIGEA